MEVILDVKLNKMTTDNGDHLRFQIESNDVSQTMVVILDFKLSQMMSGNGGHLRCQIESNDVRQWWSS